MIRWSMFTGWYELFRGSKREFVSLDARIEHKERPQFELVKIASPISEEITPIDNKDDYGRFTQTPTTRTTTSQSYTSSTKSVRKQDDHGRSIRTPTVRTATTHSHTAPIRPKPKQDAYGITIRTPGARTATTQGHTSPMRPDRPYRQHTKSFSGPRPPSATGQYQSGWRPEEAYLSREPRIPVPAAGLHDFDPRNPYDWRTA
jgi:hypothetical protein